MIEHRVGGKKPITRRVRLEDLRELIEHVEDLEQALAGFRTRGCLPMLPASDCPGGRLENPREIGLIEIDPGTRALQSLCKVRQCVSLSVVRSVTYSVRRYGRCPKDSPTLLARCKLSAAHYAPRWASPRRGARRQHALRPRGPASRRSYRSHLRRRRASDPAPVTRPLGAAPGRAADVALHRRG